MSKRWRLLHADEEKVRTLQTFLKVHTVVCRLLVQRGIESFEAARAFFRPQLTALHSPWLMKDMEKAVARIDGAMHKHQKILVYGDYDVDGTTAVACLYGFLKKFGAQVDFYIPHRYKEGYGISQAGIAYAVENQFQLIIAVDCGIKSVGLIQLAKDQGIDFIICDHHLPDDDIPNAVAILNPKQKDCTYPFKELCGCGVVFKLIMALTEHFQKPIDTAYHYLDLVATAIAADIVSVSGENRILAFHGLKKANENPNFGIKALSTLSALKGKILLNALVFLIGPRINAAGRMDDAKKAVYLFIASSLEEAMHWAEQLHTDNTNRKEADASITKQALEMISGDAQNEARFTTVLFQPHWHKGVVGIVASRLIDHYYKPTIVLTRSGDVIGGSARSVAGFNVYEAVHQCKDLLIGYGGHFYAAGMTLNESNIEAFSEKFEKVVQASIHPDLRTPEIIIDAAIHFKDITQAFYNIIEQMEPFGPDNQRPAFLTRNVRDTGFSKLLKEKHLRFVVEESGIVLTGIGFNMPEHESLLLSGAPVDIVYKLEENEWNGEKKIQLKIIDCKPGNADVL